jgi:hypothetical protein
VQLQGLLWQLLVSWLCTCRRGSVLTVSRRLGHCMLKFAGSVLTLSCRLESCRARVLTGSWLWLSQEQRADCVL